MGRSQETFNKKEVRNKKEKKRKEKAQKRLARKENKGGSSLDDMIAYVDENGQLTSTPPDPTKKQEIELEDIEVSVPKFNEREEVDPILKGTLVYFNDSKGYGFIKIKGSQDKVFVHVNNMIDDNIIEGNNVTFETEKGPKGLAAVRVHKDK